MVNLRGMLVQCGTRSFSAGPCGAMGEVMVMCGTRSFSAGPGGAVGEVLV